jgi:hypothetical protein
VGSKKQLAVAADGCELCGASAEFSAIPLWPESGSPPPPGLTRVSLCASCLADGVPPGWHIVKRQPPRANAKKRRVSAQPLDLPTAIYRWNIWRRDDGTTFLSLGHARDPVESETLVRSFEAENWLRAEQVAFGTTPPIDKMLEPLVGVLHQYPRVLITKATLGHNERGEDRAVIGLTIDTVSCLRRLLRALVATNDRPPKPCRLAVSWELAMDVDAEWFRKLPPNGMALTLTLCSADGTLAGVAGFTVKLAAQTPLAKILRNAQRQS